MRLDIVSDVEVDAPPEAVWAVLADIAAWPEWSRDCVEVWGVSGGLGTVGTALSFRLRMAGVPVPFSVTVQEADPPNRVVWSSVKWTITGTRTHSIEALDGGRSRVTDHKRFEHPVLPLPWFYPRPIIRRMSRRWLDDLAAYLAA